MTTRTIEVERTVTESEQVDVCDECGLDGDADGYGELVEYTTESDECDPIHFHEMCKMSGGAPETVGDVIGGRTRDLATPIVAALDMSDVVMSGVFAILVFATGASLAVSYNLAIAFGLVAVLVAMVVVPVIRSNMEKPVYLVND